MNIAIATTTIRNPILLRQFREMDDSVLFVVAGDTKTPHGELEKLAHELGNMYYIHPQVHDKLGYSCAAHIPNACIQKRNLAILEAVRQGADIIYVWDDDNQGNDGHFSIIQAFLSDAFAFPCWRNTASPWLNPGHFADQPYIARGFPLLLRHAETDYQCTLQRAPIGIMQGLVLGDPDIDAVERIAKQPVVTDYRLNNQAGFTINPKETWAPFNSQSTAWRRDLAPLMLLPPGLGRYDDIFGSYLAQRVMQETDHHVYFGQPFVRQERNHHDLIRDLEQELFGMRYTERFVDDLKAIALSPTASILDNLATLVDGIGDLDYMPAQAVSFVRAWVEDMGRLL